MKFRFFVVPMFGGEEAAQYLNRFCATSRVSLVDRDFVSDGARRAWAICVSYPDRPAVPRHDFR